MNITKTDLFNNVYVKSWTWCRLTESEQQTWIKTVNKLCDCHRIAERSKYFEAVVDISYTSFLYGLGYSVVNWRE